MWEKKIVCGLQERGTWQGDIAMSKHRIRWILVDGVWFSFGTFWSLTAKLLIDKNASNHFKMICVWKKNYVWFERIRYLALCKIRVHKTLIDGGWFSLGACWSFTANLLIERCIKPRQDTSCVEEEIMCDLPKQELDTSKSKIRVAEILIGLVSELTEGSPQSWSHKNPSNRVWKE